MTMAARSAVALHDGRRRTFRQAVAPLLAALLLAVGGAGAGTAEAAAVAAPAVHQPSAEAPVVATRSVDPLAPLLQATLAAAQAGSGDSTLIELAPFYLGRGFAPAFSGDRERLERGRQILAVLVRADLEGLDPQAYEIDRLSSLAAAARPDGSMGKPVEQAEFELRLARALVRYALDVSSGRAGPEHEQDGGRRTPDPNPPTSILAMAAATADLPGWLEGLPPSSPHYARLRTALAEWRAKLGRVHWTPVPDGRTLEPGMAGPEVVALRMRLVEEGLLAPPAHAGQFSALYDSALRGPVEAFQRRYGLGGDGIVGARTLRALNATVAQRVEQIRVNMERRRWLPRDLGERYVFVNLADFTLKVVDHDRTIHTSRVVVGAPFTATPMMSNAISHVVLNPYWNVPRSIMTRELLPQLQQDPGRLSRDRLRLFAGSGPEAVEVDPRTVDWSKVTPASWRYRIRQDAGPDNSLGVIKFMFPNADDIYLHDTPTKYLFNRSVRTFSHGCIRVEDPLALADVLLAGQGWPRTRLEKVIEAGQPERFVRLQTEVPIHLAYITAWVGKSGRLQFLDDVYGRDALLQQALGTRNS